MKHIGTRRIETNRLILRQFELSDAEAVYVNWANDNEVTKFLTWPAHTSVDITKGVLTQWINQYQDNNFYQWAMVLKSINEPIGSIGVVQQRDDIKMVHIGYCIGKKWWHQNITSEALTAIIDFLINEVGVNRIESRHDPLNPNSGKVMMKCGLQYEGTMRKADINNQGICDYSMYGLLAENYKIENEKF